MWPRDRKKSDHSGIIIIFHELSLKKFILTLFPAFILDKFEKTGPPCRVAHLPDSLAHFFSPNATHGFVLLCFELFFINDSAIITVTLMIQQ